MNANTESEKLQDVLTVVVDSRNGYSEALEDTKHADMAAFFSSMKTLKARHVAALETLLRDRGVSPDDDGSFLTIINRAIFSIASVFGGVGQNVLPGLIDGEGRIIEYYDEAIVIAANQAERDVLEKQRAELRQMIDTMQAMKSKPA